MPTIKVSISDLERLIGKRLNADEIKKYLALLKCEVEKIDGDILEYEANQDRPDIFSVEGLARSLRNFMNLPLKQLNFKISTIKGYAEEIPERPYIALAIVKDLVLDDEAVRQIMQLQEKLATTYGRERRKASIGVYDLDKVQPPIYYKTMDPDSSFFTPLNTTRKMSLRDALTETDQGRLYGKIISNMKRYPVLMDSSGQILSLAPIVNGESSKVDVSTKNILIDSTSIDKDTAVDMVTIMAVNIAERSRSGTIEAVEVFYPDAEKVVAPRMEKTVMEINIDDVNSLIGTSISVAETLDLLKRHYYEAVEIGEKYLRLKIPVFRIDVKSWVDIAEDISISLGYHNIGSEADSLPFSTHPGRIHPIEAFSRKVRDLLLGMSFIEVANYMMSNEQVQLGIFGLNEKMFTVANPRSERFTGVRIWLAPGLLETVAENSGKRAMIKIFEIGDVAIPGDLSNHVQVERHLGIAISHDKATLTDGLSVVASMLEHFKVAYKFIKGRKNGFLEERTSYIEVNDTYVGFVGEVHPAILHRNRIPHPVVISEINLSKLIKLVHH